MSCVAGLLGPLEHDRRRDPDHRVEQHDPLRQAHGGELERQPAAEAVPDHRRALDAGGFERLAEIVDVLRDRPGRLPTRAPVAAEVGGEHPKAAQTLLGQPAIAAAVGHHAVKAEDGWSGRVAPLVDVQEHGP